MAATHFLCTIPVRILVKILDPAPNNATPENPLVNHPLDAAKVIAGRISVGVTNDSQSMALERGQMITTEGICYGLDIGAPQTEWLIDGVIPQSV